MNIKSPESKLFATADTHFGHANIIKFCNRPFKSVEEMDRYMAGKWNARIAENDIVLFLGDFSFSRGNREAELLRDLHGYKICIRGNHDKHSKSFVDYTKNFYWKGQDIFLCHFAHRVWDKSHFGVWHLYGHSHGGLPDDPNSLSMDVGVDTHDFEPYSFEEIQAHMAKKNFKPIKERE